jgi:hypothetical protein
MDQVLSAWSIENELVQIAGEPTVEAAVHRLGLLREDERYAAVSGGPSWERGGRETYIFPFSVLSEDGLARRFLLKAAVTYSPLDSLTDVLAKWVSRRRLLESTGVRVPRLHFWGKGILLEEFIPHELSGHFVHVGYSHPLAIGFFRYAGTLARLGFRPVSPFADLRTDGQCVVPVDFGWDLGPAGLEPQDPMELYGAAVQWLVRECRMGVEGESLRELRDAYLQSLR